uniref:Uncharacterized protein n=1 Tax=Sphaerodactylus townsendi TaxID=933632 RepID=A0ACB8FUJ7_9SAUR
MNCLLNFSIPFYSRLFDSTESPKCEALRDLKRQLSNPTAGKVVTLPGGTNEMSGSGPLISKANSLSEADIRRPESGESALSTSGGPSHGPVHRTNGQWHADTVPAEPACPRASARAEGLGTAQLRPAPGRAERPRASAMAAEPNSFRVYKSWEALWELQPAADSRCEAKPDANKLTGGEAFYRLRQPYIAVRKHSRVFSLNQAQNT